MQLKDFFDGLGLDDDVARQFFVVVNGRQLDLRRAAVADARTFSQTSLTDFDWSVKVSGDPC